MPQIMQKFCAYHPNQQLTNFCTCVQCLLPVCPTCIKVHTQQHLHKGTHPQFEKLDTVFIQVYQSCGSILQGLERLKQELLQVQKVKKQNQSLILQKIKLYRNKLIRQFQRALTQIQNQIVKRFHSEDQNLIKQIQHIDMTIQKMQHDLHNQMLGLEGQQGLRRMIFSLSDNYEIKCLKELTCLNERIKEMLKRNVYLEVEQDRVEDVKASVMAYMKLGSIQWGITKPNNNNRQSNTGRHNTQLSNRQSNTGGHNPQQANNELTAFARQNPVQCHQSINSSFGNHIPNSNSDQVASSRKLISNHYHHP